MRVISGYQTGADRGGVHAAYDLKMGGMPVETGGWIPRDRRAEDGQISMETVKRYGLSVHAGNGYPPRTEQNVKDSTVTVLFGNMSSPGCKLTIKCCKLHSKPYLPVDWEWIRTRTDLCVADVAAFISYHKALVVNVAGNREETNPGIYHFTYSIITNVLQRLC